MIIQATTRIIIRITVIMLPATELTAAIMIHMMPITDHQMTIQTIVQHPIILTAIILLTTIITITIPAAIIPITTIMATDIIIIITTMVTIMVMETMAIITTIISTETNITTDITVRHIHQARMHHLLAHGLL